MGEHQTIVLLKILKDHSARLTKMKEHISYINIILNALAKNFTKFKIEQHGQQGVSNIKKKIVSKAMIEQLNQKIQMGSIEANLPGFNGEKAK